VSTPAALRVVEGHWIVFRRVWRGTILTGFLQPLLFLAGMGLGVGSLVSANGTDATVLGGASYVAFIAPGLLVATAMMTASVEATWPVLDNFTWQRGYERMITAPLSVGAVLAGQVYWWIIRLSISATAVSIAMLLFPDARSTGLVLAVPAAVLSGLAFATPIAAFSATRPVGSSGAFAALTRFVITPLFLFGGVFYPVTQLPAWLRPVAYVTPLYHGVALCRGLTLHTLGAADAVVHVAVLVVYVAAGLAICMVAFRRRLLL
jgi:lipooligosaccharide transport system permease protein